MGFAIQERMEIRHPLATPDLFKCHCYRITTGSLSGLTI